MEIYKFVFSPIAVNTYILVDKSGDCAILDCGCYSKNEDTELVEFIENKKINPVLLLNTHCHLDHIFGNRFVLLKYKLRTFSSALDESNRIESVKHAMIFGLTMDNPPEPAGFLSDNQVIRFGTTEFVVLNVPGHTSGSLAFYCENSGCVFTGDALFSGSIGRTDLKGGNFETLLNSIKNRLFVLPPSTIVYPGHGNSTTIENEMKSNPFFV